MKTPQELQRICDAFQYASLLLGALLICIVYFGWDTNIAVLFAATISYLVIYFVSVAMIFPPLGITLGLLKTNLPVRMSVGRISRLFIGALPFLVIVLMKIATAGSRV